MSFLIGSLWNVKKLLVKKRRFFTLSNPTAAHGPVSQTLRLIVQHCKAKVCTVLQTTNNNTNIELFACLFNFHLVGFGRFPFELHLTKNWNFASTELLFCENLKWWIFQVIWKLSARKPRIAKHFWHRDTKSAIC